MSPSIVQQAADGFDDLHDATVGSDTGEQAGEGFDNIGELFGVEDASGEVAAVADPTRSASGPAELLVRSNPVTGLPALQADAQAIFQQAMGDDRDPSVPGATSPLFGSRDASDAVEESGGGKGADTAGDAAGAAVDEVAGAAEDAWNAATPNLPINFQQGVLLVIGLVVVYVLGQLFDVGLGGASA